MKKKNVVFVFLFIMLFSAAKGTTLPPPPGWGASASVAPSGQTLYYIIRGDTAIVTYPSDWFNNYWGSFTKPTGDLIIPDNVEIIENAAFYQIASPFLEIHTQ